MNRIKRFFSTDPGYTAEVARYGRGDAVLALLLYAILIAAYFWMGWMYQTQNMYLGISVNLLFMAACFVLTLIRKQPLSSLGFTKQKIGKSAIAGLTLGLLMVLGNNVLFAVIGQNQLAPFGKIMYNLFYYMVIISLFEEVFFRGYLQKRIYGLLKNPVAAVVTVGVLFMLFHIPFQLGAANMALLPFLAANWPGLLMTFVWHIVFDFLFRKFNSILPGTIFHGLMDWGNYLFV